VQEVVHRGDELLGLESHPSKSVAEVTQHVVLEEPPFALGQQLAVGSDSRTQPLGEVDQQHLTGLVAAGGGEDTVNLGDPRLERRRWAVLQL
jgi:hypothetical protein